MARALNSLRLITVAALLSTTATAQAASPATATTRSGPVRGIEDGSVAAFKGVPYATPPVGALRWKPPLAPVAWSTPRDAGRFAASCYQAQPRTFGPYKPEFLTPGPLSEDCLYLNVWTPAARGQRLPVLVWIHGGGFNSGSGAVPIYDGARLAAQGVVVVTINYRLGVFGFLAHPALSQESPQRVSGNYGLLDQVAALKWVRDNIEAFGGDPSNVTIAGQSAGAASVNDLLLAPSAKGLFKRAIAQSGSGMGVDALPLVEAEAQGEALGAAAGAKDAASLRALSAETLVKLSDKPVDLSAKEPPIRFAPNIDGVVISADPESPGARPVSDVPLLTGFNADEAWLPFKGPPSPGDFEDYVRRRYGGMADRFLALYPHSDLEATARSAAEIGRDRYMASLLLWLEHRSAQSEQRLYAYRFNHAYPMPDGPAFGAFHTAETPYLFGVLDTPNRPFLPQDQAVSKQIQAYWLRFIRAGDTNAAGAATWSPFKSGAITVMALGDQKNGPIPAVSSPERLQAFREYVASGQTLSLF